MLLKVLCFYSSYLTIRFSPRARSQVLIDLLLSGLLINPIKRPCFSKFSAANHFNSVTEFKTI